MYCKRFNFNTKGIILEGSNAEMGRVITKLNQLFVTEHITTMIKRHKQNNVVSLS